MDNVWDAEGCFHREIEELGEKVITTPVLRTAFYGGRNRGDWEAARQTVMNGCLDLVEKLIHKSGIALTPREHMKLVWSIADRGWDGDGWDFLQGMQDVLIEAKLLPEKNVQ